jgi:hypothetical protein
MNTFKAALNFKEVVEEIFKDLGYKTTSKGYDELYDILVQNDEKQDKDYKLEVKYSQAKTEYPYNLIHRAINRLKRVADEKSIPVLVLGFILSDEERKRFGDNNDIIIIDIANLLSLVKDNEMLRNRLVSSLTYTVDDIEPKECVFTLDGLNHGGYTKSLIAEMNLLASGKQCFNKFEELCKKMLENVFSGDLDLWKDQQPSNDGLYRFDLLCRIKDGNNKAFWKIIEEYFNSKYVIFEFKNYEEQISQKEIYTTEKYLYEKALRRVAIIIAANGFSENADWAARGCLRETGKLIVLLSKEDLVEMNMMKERNDDPSALLLDKLDYLLATLEK